MRKFLVTLAALFTIIAFVGGALAEEKKAAKQKVAKAKTVAGTVLAYDEGKTIKVKGAKDKEWTFDISADAKIKGEVKEAVKVVVDYKKEGDKLIATSISVTAKKAKKKAKSD